MEIFASVVIQIICPLTCQCVSPLFLLLLACSPCGLYFVLAHSSVGSVFTQVFTALGLSLTQVKELLLQIIVLGRSSNNFPQDRT